MRRLRLGMLVCLCLSALAPVLAAPAAKWSVNLPDAGTYSYWVQAKSGSVSVLPTVTHKTTQPLPDTVAAGDTLFVLDAHTGQVAARPLAAPGAVALMVADFKPLPTLGPPAAPASPAATAPPPKEHPDGPSGLVLLLTWLLGLAVAGAVGWFILRLVQTRGEPLLALARRVGVDVPDPKPLDPHAEAPLPLYEAPKPRLVEKIPEDAGAPPAPRRPESLPRKLAPPTGEPQLVGTQGLAAGSTFALSDGSIMVGRDGDNGIVLAEHTVSRHHARLTRDGEGQIVITDEGSANGVYVNGERVPQATLMHGDEVKIGDNYFRFEA